MKRLIIFLTITMAAVCGMQAAQVSEVDARQVADMFFSARPTRSVAKAAPVATRLSYTANQQRFYVFDRGALGGFVVVSGDDRLPQVLGYGESGDFSAPDLPPSLRYWLDEMDRQIAFLQSHDDAVAHRPAPRETGVGPLMTTIWNQDWPYNLLCPTYSDNVGNTSRAVTGCVATAAAQIMNYHQWPPVGTGSHSYVCNVNNMTETELSADFSQSTYRWDLMLDSYDENSSEESCEAVAKLMSDVGISMDMDYGSSSGARERDAMLALVRYFGYYDKCYLMNRDNYGAEEWDQMLVDEISANRPILYCGYDLSTSTGGGHAFVVDGFNTDGYFHLNWGWGGHYDGYFLVSALAPGGMDFKYMQDGMFGVVPAHEGASVNDVLYVRGLLKPVKASVALGENLGMAMMMDNFVVEGNMLDTAGYEDFYGRRSYYALIPMWLGVYDMNGVERDHMQFNRKESLDPFRWSSGQNVYMTLPTSLEEGEYRVKLSYSLDDGENYDQPVLDPRGNEVYVKMHVEGDSAYLSDCFLSATYSIDSFNLPVGIQVNEPITIEANMSNPSWSSESRPAGNVYLALMKDGEKVVSSEMYRVMMPSQSSETYQMQLTAPAEWGRYELAMFDESGYQMQKIVDMWMGEAEDYALPLFVLPVCEQLVEDFESMTANNSTSDKNVQGNFVTWNFNKAGVRAPGEGRCNGENAVMLKKASTVYTAEPLAHNFFLAQATFFNQTSSLAKYTLEYSYDGGTTWEKANTLEGPNVVEVPDKSRVTANWVMNLSASKPANFRIAMIAGSGATYVDDVALYYIDTLGDVNLDGEVNIGDLNAVIDMILSGLADAKGDVNGDGEVNIADVNAIIALISGGA